MNNLKYVDEHRCCFHYEGGVDSTVQFLKVENDPNYHYQISTIQHKIFYLAEGTCEMVCNQKRYIIEKGNVYLFPVGAEVDIYVTSTARTEIFIMRVFDIEHLCHNYSLDMLMHEGEEEVNRLDLHFLSGNDVVRDFFILLKCTFTDGMKCRFFLESKVVEFLYLLRAYYYKEDLLNFFYPILSNDIVFSDFVLRHHYKAKTVGELATMANYSLSGFQKRFRKVFGISAFTWMRREKMKNIYADVTSSSLTLKEISEKFQFSSTSHFNDYCKNNFKYTPGFMRKNKVKLQLSFFEIEDNDNETDG